MANTTKSLSTLIVISAEIDHWGIFHAGDFRKAGDPAVLLPVLKDLVHAGRLAQLYQQPLAFTLTLRTIIIVMDEAAATQPAAALSDSLPVALLALLEDLATVHQAQAMVLPMLRRWLETQNAASTAVLQPVIVLAAFRRSGLHGYLTALHPAVLDCALVRQEAQDRHAISIQDSALQVWC